MIDCAKLSTAPSVTFTFGGKAYPLTPQDYVLQVQGQCISGFAGMNLPGQPNLWIVGDVFLRKYYSVYDLGRNQVGFAESA